MGIELCQKKVISFINMFGVLRTRRKALPERYASTQQTIDAPLTVHNAKSYIGTRVLPTRVPKLSLGQITHESLPDWIEVSDTATWWQFLQFYMDFQLLQYCVVKVSIILVRDVFMYNTPFPKI